VSALPSTWNGFPALAFSNEARFSTLKIGGQEHWPSGFVELLQQHVGFMLSKVGIFISQLCALQVKKVDGGMTLSFVNC